MGCLWRPSIAAFICGAAPFKRRLRNVFTCHSIQLTTMDLGWGLQAARTAWTWGVQQTQWAANFALSLPSTCLQSMAHTALVCAGTQPVYFVTAGFAPLHLSWGWLLLGVLLGCCFQRLLRELALILLEVCRCRGQSRRPAARDELLEDIEEHG